MLVPHALATPLESVIVADNFFKSLDACFSKELALQLIPKKTLKSMREPLQKIVVLVRRQCNLSRLFDKVKQQFIPATMQALANDWNKIDFAFVHSRIAWMCVDIEKTTQPCNYTFFN